MDDVTVYEKLGPKVARKLDRQDLAQDVKARGDMTLKERARYFGVSRNCVCTIFFQLRISRKKHLPALEPGMRRYKEPGPMKRRRYLRLRERYRRYLLVKTRWYSHLYAQWPCFLNRMKEILDALHPRGKPLGFYVPIKARKRARL